VLFGPEPRKLVDRVASDDLRDEVRVLLPELAAWAPAPTESGPMSRWKQAYLVLSCCRMLHTLATGTVTSKQEAGSWALSELPERWAPLVRHSLAERPDPWVKVHEPADAEIARETLAFVAFALAAADDA
jgi:hypothetical protein